MFLALGAVKPRAVPNQLGRVLAYKIGGTAVLPLRTPTIDRNASPPPQLQASAVAVKHGADLYQTYCWPCHGASAISSGVLPDLRHSPILSDAAAWKSIVLDGARKANGMASFAKWINREDAEALRAYVASEAARAAPVAAAKVD
jgi:mono/diheme cytochrome c family protein